MIGAITGQKTFYDGKLIEVSGVSLPEVTPMTSTVNMPGGEVDLPLSLYGSMEITVAFNGLSAGTAPLYDVGVHKLEHRYVQTNLGDGSASKEELVKVYADVVSKAKTSGEPEIGAPQENEVMFEVLRYRMVVAGKEILLIDKRTGKVVINGVDRTSSRVKLLG